MTIEIPGAALRAYDEAWKQAHNAPDAKPGDGRRAGLAAVLNLPEVRRAVVADMPTDEVIDALHASSYATPEEAAAAMMAAVHKAGDDPETWGLR